MPHRQLLPRLLQRYAFEQQLCGEVLNGPLHLHLVAYLLVVAGNVPVLAESEFKRPAQLMIQPVLPRYRCTQTKSFGQFAVREALRLAAHLDLVVNGDCQWVGPVVEFVPHRACGFGDCHAAARAYRLCNTFTANSVRELAPVAFMMRYIWAFTVASVVPNR